MDHVYALWLITMTKWPLAGDRCRWGGRPPGADNKALLSVADVNYLALNLLLSVDSWMRKWGIRCIAIGKSFLDDAIKHFKQIIGVKQQTFNNLPGIS